MIASPIVWPDGSRRVGLDRERDDDGQSDRGGGAGHADRLVGVGHGDGADHLRAGLGERSGLEPVVRGRLGGRHRAADDVAVASRADDAVDDRRYRRSVPGEVADELDGASVDGREADRVVPEPGTPIEVGAPGRGVDHHPDAQPLGQIEVWGVVADKRGSSRVGVEQRERGEVGEVDPVTEDEGGLQAAVGDVGAPGAQLGERDRSGHVSAFLHR